MVARSLASPADILELGELGVVSRETIDRFGNFIEELRRWQKVKNLVSSSTFDDVWQRHIIDSVQLFALQPDSRRWLDLGSGGGLPGIILGILLSEVGGHIHLVEANARKCAFLRSVARETGAAATVHQKRVENCIAGFVGDVDVVTARALAPLSQLVEWTQEVVGEGALGLFPKGQDVNSELTDAAKLWKIGYELIVSRTDCAARIVRINSIEGVSE